MDAEALKVCGSGVGAVVQRLQMNSGAGARVYMVPRLFMHAGKGAQFFWMQA